MDPDLTRSQCVLIGNATYTDPRIPDLPGARASVAAMGELLTSDLCGWPENRITRLIDIASPSDLARKVRAAVLDSRDVLLCYYVGHGIRTTEGQLALALADTDPDPELLPDTAALYDRLAYILRGSQAATKLVILDCCHAELGNTANFLFQSADIAESYPVEGLYFIGASARTKKAKAPLGGAMTFFTESFVRVVNRGIPNLPDRLRLDQIFREVRTDLVRAGFPEPVESGIRGARQFAFARNNAPPVTLYDPDEELSRLRKQHEEAAARIQDLEARLARVGKPRSSPPPAGRLSQRLTPAASAFGDELVKFVSRGTVDETPWKSINELLEDGGVGASPAMDLIGRLEERISPQHIGAVTSLDQQRLRLILGEELLRLLGPDYERGLDLSAAAGRTPLVIVTGDSESDRALVIEGLCRILAGTHKPVALIGINRKSGRDHPLLLRGRQAAWRAVQVAQYLPESKAALSAADTDAVTHADVIVVDFPGEIRENGEVVLGHQQQEDLAKFGHPREILLVYDATIGLNGLRNARALNLAYGLTGIVLTRADTTTKPLIAITIQHQISMPGYPSVPVKFLRLADRPVELLPFDPRDYVSALIGATIH